ncbi:hypothetical protein JNUCC74_09345 [Cerasibacillus sp. JNUCC 74]
MNQKEIVKEHDTSTNYPQQPHGGKLVNQVLTGKKRDKELARAKQLAHSYG